MCRLWPLANPRADIIEDIHIGYYIGNSGYNSVAKGGKKTMYPVNASGKLYLHDAKMNNQSPNWIKRHCGRRGCSGGGMRMKTSMLSADKVICHLNILCFSTK